MRPDVGLDQSDQLLVLKARERAEVALSRHDQILQPPPQIDARAPRAGRPQRPSASSRAAIRAGGGQPAESRCASTYSRRKLRLRRLRSIPPSRPGGHVWTENKAPIPRIPRTARHNARRARAALAPHPSRDRSPGDWCRIDPPPGAQRPLIELSRPRNVVENVYIPARAAGSMKDTTALESTPPLRNAPTGTSETRCECTAAPNRSSNSRAASSSEIARGSWREVECRQ